MGNALEFILKLTDKLTPEMRQAARMSETSAAKIQSEFDRIRGGGKRMAASVNELHQRLDAINKVRFSTTVQREFDIATRAAQRLERQIDKLEGKGRGSSGGFSVAGMVKGNLLAGGIQQVGRMLIGGASDAYNTTLTDAGLRTAINATTKGRGNEAVAMTRDISGQYGLNYEASLEGVRTLTGGLMGMNMTLEEQMKIFKGVSTGVAAMKLNSEQSKGAFLALGQMASKGTVNAEELRQQLAERIPGAFSIAARAMEVTEMKLNDMLQKGEVAAKDFLPRFAAEMEKTFGQDALKAATGPQAIQERFNNAIYNIKTNIGNGLLPMITPAIERLTQLATAVLPYIQSALSGVSSFVSNITSGSGQWSGYFNVIQSYALAFWNTIKSVAGNIWNIVSGVVEWMGKSEIIKDLFWLIGKLGEGLFWVIRKVGDGLEWVWSNIIKPIVDAIDTAYSFVKWAFGGSTVSAMSGGMKVSFGGSTNVTNVTAPTSKLALAAQVPGGKVVNMNTPGSGLSSDNEKIKSQADSINSGGQRSIVINIGKQIEKLEVHVMNSKEAADEIESAVREAVRKVVYSLNAVAS